MSLRAATIRFYGNSNIIIAIISSGNLLLGPAEEIRSQMRRAMAIRRRRHGDSGRGRCVYTLYTLYAFNI